MGRLDVAMGKGSTGYSNGFFRNGGDCARGHRHGSSPFSRSNVCSSDLYRSKFPPGLHLWQFSNSIHSYSRAKLVMRDHSGTGANSLPPSWNGLLLHQLYGRVMMI